MRSAEDQGAVPDFDEEYERMFRDLLPTIDDAFVAEVVEYFRKMPVNLYSKSIGRWINQQLAQQDPPWTREHLAGRIGVDHSAVTRWIAGGNITLNHLVLILIAFRRELRDLPLPARRELAIEAYLAAVTYIRRERLGEPGSRPLDRERFWCLLHLFSEPYWRRAVHRKDLELKEREARRVVAKAAEDLGAEPSIRGVRDLEQLVREWAGAWILCLEVLHGHLRGWSVR